MLVTSLCNHASLTDTVLGAAHSQRFSIFGPGGYQKFSRRYKLEDFTPVYGNYAIISKNRTNVRISTDHFGLFRIFVYRSGRVWAVSDSVQELLSFAKAHRLPTTPYPVAAYAFMLKQGVGQQLSSFRTPIAEIELVPHWNDLIVEAGELRFENQRDVHWSEDLQDMNYQAGQFFSSLLNSYLNHGMKPFIRMSAGLDSRCTLAAMMSIADKDGLKGVGLQTGKEERRAHERRIVMDLMKHLPFHEVGIQPLSRVNWSYWKRNYLNTESNLARIVIYGPPAPAYSGACGELAREFYHWGGTTAAIDMPDTIPSSVRELIIQDINDAISIFDGQCADALTIENKHYHMFRNRFHFGKAFTETIFNYPPIVYSLLSYGTGRGNKEPLHRLIYELGGEDVLRHPFDEPEKQFAGAIPMNWQRLQFPSAELYDREIFLDDIQDNVDRVAQVFGLGGREQSLGDGKAFAGKSLLSDCAKAIDAIEQRDLVGRQLIHSARMQLKALEKKGDRALPGRFPSLLAALSLGMAINSERDV